MDHQAAKPSRYTRLSRWIGLAALVGGSQTFAAESGSNYSRSQASALRAQQVGQPSDQYDAQQPAWFVERDDNTSIRLTGLIQSRYGYSTRQLGFFPRSERQTTGFSMPRVQLGLDGTLVSSRFNYRVSMDFGDAELSRGRGTSGGLIPGNTGTARLLDAYAQYNFAGKREGYYFKFGQFQSIVMTEEAIQSKYQLAADRTMTSELFGPGYTQGIALGRVDDQFAWEISLNDGGRYIGSREVDNTDFASLDEADLGISGRFDWKIQGSWDQFEDFTSFRGSNIGSKLGGGVLYQFQGQTNPGDFTPGFVGVPVDSGQIFTWTLDYMYQADGWNFFAAYTGQYVDWEFSTSTLGIMNNSVVLQGGWFLDDKTEFFARLETFWLDKLFRNGFSTPDGYIHRIGTVGVNYYILPDSHAAKITADVSYAFDSLFVIALGAGGSIVLPDPSVTGFSGLTEREIVVRLQLQLAF